VTYYGNISAASPERSISLNCEICGITWTGCQDQYECPMCGNSKAWREYMDSFSEWLDEKQARDDALGAEQEAYTFGESEARRKESHT
jgi:predicted RNA-binding Zn-ribbon protein involved in translation (DUF1610 family)